MSSSSGRTCSGVLDVKTVHETFSFYLDRFEIPVKT